MCLLGSHNILKSLSTYRVSFLHLFVLALTPSSPSSSWNSSEDCSQYSPSYIHDLDDQISAFTSIINHQVHLFHLKFMFVHDTIGYFSNFNEIVPGQAFMYRDCDPWLWNMTMVTTGLHLLYDWDLNTCIKSCVSWLTITKPQKELPAITLLP